MVGTMEWTPRRMAILLLAATGFELVAALAVSAIAGLSYLQALVPVFLVTGVGWTIVGMFASGSGEITPPTTTAGGYYGWAQPSTPSELYVSRAGSERVAEESMQRLAAGSGFMIPAVLYGVALFVVALWLAA